MRENKVMPGFSDRLAHQAFGLTVAYYLAKYAAYKTMPGRFVVDARVVGLRIFETYIFPFEAVSILLLAAVVGALLLSSRSMNQRPKAAVDAAADLPKAETTATEVTR